jgi:copper(I)-binding protein
MIARYFIGLWICFCIFGGHAYTKGVEQVSLTHPTIRPAKVGQNSAAFVIIENHSPNDLKIIEASSPVAETVELHRSFAENGVNKMRPVEHILIQAGKQVVLESGGLHIMLLGLKSDIVDDPANPQEIPITLTFDSGESITRHFSVEKCGIACH